MDTDDIDPDKDIKRQPITVDDWLRCGLCQESAEIMAGKRRSTACHGFAGIDTPLLHEEYLSNHDR